MGYEQLLIIRMMFLLLTKLIVYKLSLLFLFSLANILSSFISQQKGWQDDSRSLTIFESLFKKYEISYMFPEGLSFFSFVYFSLGPLEST